MNQTPQVDAGHDRGAGGGDNDRCRQERHAEARHGF